MSGIQDEYLSNHPDRGRSFDDSEPFSSIPVNKARGLPETSFKSVSADKERANNVAKIKVMVCYVISSFYFDTAYLCFILDWTAI